MRYFPISPDQSIQFRLDLYTKGSHNFGCKSTDLNFVYCSMTDSKLYFKLLAGCFRRSKRKGQLMCMDQVIFRVMYQGGRGHSLKLILYLFYLLFLLYFTMCSLSVVIDCAASNYNQGLYWAQPRVLSLINNRGLPFLSSVYVKIAYLCSNSTSTENECRRHEFLVRV